MSDAPPSNAATPTSGGSGPGTPGSASGAPGSTAVTASSAGRPAGPPSSAGGFTDPSNADTRPGTARGDVREAGEAANGEAAKGRALGTLTDPGDPLPVDRRGAHSPSETFTITFPRPRTVAARLANRLAAALAPPPPPEPATDTTGGSTEIGPSRGGDRPAGREGSPAEPGAVVGAAAEAGVAGGRSGWASRTGVAGWVRSIADLPRAAATILTVLVVLALTLTGDHPPGSDPTAGQSLQDSTGLDPQSQSETFESPFDVDTSGDGANIFPPLTPSTTPTGAPLAAAVTQTLAAPPLSAPSTKVTVLPAAAPPARLPASPGPGQTSAAAKLASSGIPARAKTAYVNAANRMATVNPACRLPWNLIAAIGRIESNHGRTTSKTSLAAGSGRAAPPIYGVRLDGSQAGTAVIRDTDKGALDTDTQFDRAVGPMQFLPATWRSFAMDGDNDGATDPQDIDDAALTAGRYLCTGITSASTSNLSGNAGQWNAAYRYNHSKSYANLVLAMSLTYATGKATDVVNPPSGVTTAPAVVTITFTPPAAATTTTSTATTPTTVATTTSIPVTTSTTTTTTPPTTSTVTTTVGDPNPPPVSVITVTVSITTTTITETSTSTSTSSSSTSSSPAGNGSGSPSTSSSTPSQPSAGGAP